MRTSPKRDSHCCFSDLSILLDIYTLPEVPGLNREALPTAQAMKALVAFLESNQPAREDEASITHQLVFTCKQSR